MAQTSYDFASKKYGKYSHQAYYEADRLSFVLRSFLNSDGKNIEYIEGYVPKIEHVNLMKEYGSEIGKFKCIYDRDRTKFEK